MKRYGYDRSFHSLICTDLKVSHKENTLDKPFFVKVAGLKSSLKKIRKETAVNVFHRIFEIYGKCFSMKCLRMVASERVCDKIKKT